MKITIECDQEVKSVKMKFYGGGNAQIALSPPVNNNVTTGSSLSALDRAVDNSKPIATVEAGEAFELPTVERDAVVDESFGKSQF